MARARNTRDPDLVSSEEVLGAAPPSPEETLAQFFGTAGADDLDVQVWELSGDRKTERSYLFRVPLAMVPSPAEFLDEILAKWGAGTYELFAQREDGRIAFRKQVHLGSERDRRRALIPSRETPAPAAAPATSSLPPELVTILAQQSRAIEAIADAVAHREPPRSTLDVARELTALKDLFAPPPAPPTSSIIEIVRDVLRLRDELGGSEGGESPLAAAAKHLGPVLSRAVERLAPPVGQVEPPAPGAVPAAAAPPAPGPATNGDDSMGMRALFAPLLNLARAAVEPRAAAEQVLDDLAARPTWVEDAVLSMVTSDTAGALDRVTALEPALLEHRPWLERVVAEIMAMISTEDAAPEGPRTDADGGAARP